MKHATPSTEPSRTYAEAYAAQYSTRDLPLAIRLYQKLMESHAGSVEADNSRMQVQNIVNAVVPKQELLSAQIALVERHFEQESDFNTGGSPVPLRVAEMSR